MSGVPKSPAIPPADAGVVVALKMEDATWDGAWGDAAVAKSAKSVHMVNICAVAFQWPGNIPSRSDEADEAADLAPPKRPLIKSAIVALSYKLERGTQSTRKCVKCMV